MKVIRSGEKGFREEKSKMFKTPEKTKGFFTLTKEGQLRLVFKHLFASMLAEYYISDVVEEKLIEKYTNIFLKEVTIRTKL